MNIVYPLIVFAPKYILKVNLAVWRSERYTSQTTLGGKHAALMVHVAKQKMVRCQNKDSNCLQEEIN